MTYSIFITTIGQMVKAEGEHSEPLVHAQSIHELLRQTGVEFNAVVDLLLKDAPNAAGERHYAIDYVDNQPPTDRAVEFEFGNSTVRASYHVDLGSPPTYRLKITTPIVVDDLQSDPMSVYPQAPHEIVEFKSSPHFKTIDVRTRAVNRLGDHGVEIPLDQYTAGGFLPPINTLGRGKIETFQSAIALFKGVVPQNPVYKQPFHPLAPSSLSSR